MGKTIQNGVPKEPKGAFPRSVANRKIWLQPLHPGEMLREEFLIPLGMTPEMLAREIKVPERVVVAIVKEKRGLDGEICLRLARFFRMTPEFWMNCQKYYELRKAHATWRQICKEVRMHSKDRKTGALRKPRVRR